MWIIIDSLDRVLACSESKEVLLESCKLTYPHHVFSQDDMGESGFTFWAKLSEGSEEIRPVAFCVECDELTSPCKLGE